ncbi:hypothetical protein HF086_010620 [Spodoptera exigua]|uniref:Uncharacterized protein n=1 Tax=Spodoptera exigua TaxID=7107 RepID=A0A922MUF5_SPOEX|nr:hypothetical protein HF086_010620 [Spodoptera exigua]
MTRYHTRVELPTASFPYKIPKRLNALSIPRRDFVESMDGPGYTQSGIRKSALNGQPSDRINDIAWPWIRRLMIVKNMYRKRFSQERLEKLERMIEASNATIYSKLANCVVDLKKQDTKESKKKKLWSEGERKKHLDYITMVAAPKKTFLPPPVKIPRRLQLLSQPRRYFVECYEGSMPQYTRAGIRQSALTGRLTDKSTDIAWPSTRMYKNRFSPDRLERIDRMIEASNATVYAKLANCTVDLKKMDARDLKKKKGWTDTEWKRKMEYISQIAEPKKVFEPPPIKRGKSMPLEALMPRIEEISLLPRFKCYKRMSQEAWYRNPMKVAPNALKYVITDRTKKLAVARVIPKDDE